jgi:hypothetical protein
MLWSLTVTWRRVWVGKAQLAGALRLGKLIYLYDDNAVSKMNFQGIFQKM